MTQTIQKNQNFNLVPYKIDNNRTIDVTQIQDDVWLTQKQMAQLFDCSKENIRLHLKSIFESQELDRNQTTKKFLAVSNEGGKQVSREKTFYNLDAIISVGYRVNSKRGVLFRQWATKIIKDRIKQEYEKRNSHKNATIPQISTEKKERAKLINTLLRKKGIKQDYIAKATGYARTTVCDVINGKYINPIILNWIEINLFSKKRKQNDFNEKSKDIFEHALHGDYAAYNKVKKILKAVAAVHNFA